MGTQCVYTETDTEFLKTFTSGFKTFISQKEGIISNCGSFYYLWTYPERALIHISNPQRAQTLSLNV